MKFWPRSNICACDSVLLDSASWMTGTLEALKLRTKGGVMPGGRYLSTVCDAAVVWARAPLMLTPRLEKDLHDPVARQRLRLDMLDVVDLAAERCARNSR